VVVRTHGPCGSVRPEVERTDVRSADSRAQVLTPDHCCWRARSWENPVAPKMSSGEFWQPCPKSCTGDPHLRHCMVLLFWSGSLSKELSNAPPSKVSGPCSCLLNDGRYIIHPTKNGEV
jgi:hypothetical protein